MKKERGIETILVVVLAAAVLFMSIGFALFGQNLEIGGTATVEKSKWDIHFDQNSYQSLGTVEATSTPTITNTSVTFAATLAKPGDTYSFSIDVTNAGTYDAILKSITMSTLTEEQATLLDYTVTYDGTAYTASQTGLSNAIAATKGAENVANSTKTVVVTVKYKDTVTAEQLPAENISVTLSATLEYEQAA